MSMEGFYQTLAFSARFLVFKVFTQFSAITLQVEVFCLACLLNRRCMAERRTRHVVSVVVRFSHVAELFLIFSH